MKTFGFPRSLRLKSKKAIDRLFDRNLARREGVSVEAALFYPIRVVWTFNVRRINGVESPCVLISVPKKKIKHAVDRVKVRRRIREAWRLQQPANVLPAMDVALTYVAQKVEDYHVIEAAVNKIICKLSEN